jgi:hypothetical protein
MEPVASSSVPDLQPRKRLGLIVLAIAGVLAIVAVVLALKFGGGVTSADDPGKAACQHIEELAEKEPQRWDRFVKALVRTVVERAWNAKKPKQVVISGDTRYERCAEAFEVIRDSISYRKYTVLAECVSKATSWRTGSSCFDDF